ncbi:hypothetical protein ABZV29_00020 [Streptomyces sp. NPDC005236]|uniref:hypothetical protein n=1 Tax=Streptomyces sp. NPDC005236 TaxID=3157028 RepID=UPI0033AB8E01
MHTIIERIGWPAVAILGGSVVLSLGILGYHATTSDSSGLDNTSAEYQEGWDAAVSLNLTTWRNLKGVEETCAIPALYDTAAKADAVRDRYSEVYFMNWSYNDRQRKEWAHGCLDAERNLTDYKVPQQSWEN